MHRLRRIGSCVQVASRPGLVKVVRLDAHRAQEAALRESQLDELRHEIAGVRHEIFVAKNEIAALIQTDQNA